MNNNDDWDFLRPDPFKEVAEKVKSYAEGLYIMITEDDMEDQRDYYLTLINGNRKAMNECLDKLELMIKEYKGGIHNEDN